MTLTEKTSSRHLSNDLTELSPLCRVRWRLGWRGSGLLQVVTRIQERHLLQLAKGGDRAVPLVVAALGPEDELEVSQRYR
mmetsp:Transcript_30917/g.43283  ORF Transcript_30917/g.43283 Transcript_30917/m.43283 type:complete len:80 (+) Transcript_30917:671-910(+)